MTNKKRKNTRDSPQREKRFAGEHQLCEKIILHASGFLSFVDFRNFVRSVWPNNDESENVRAKLWELSTHTAKLPFIDGTPLNIEYNYDPWRRNRDVLLINVKSLLPIFGKIVLPPMEEFEDVSMIENLVKIYVHHDRCMNYLYRSCACHLEKFNPHEAKAFGKPLTDGCQYGHPHHYCSKHVNHWLRFFLHPLLMAKENNEYPDEDSINNYVSFLNQIITL